MDREAQALIVWRFNQESGEDQEDSALIVFPATLIPLTAGGVGVHKTWFIRYDTDEKWVKDLKLVVESREPNCQRGIKLGLGLSIPSMAPSDWHRRVFASTFHVSDYG